LFRRLFRATSPRPKTRAPRRPRLFRFIRKLLAPRCPVRRPRDGRARLSLEVLENRLVPTGVQYHGVPLLSHVEVSAAYFEPDWASTPPYQSYTGQLTTYLGRLANSPYLDQLAEYGVTGKPIGRGSFTGSDVTSNGWNTHSAVINGIKYATIDDSDITTMLR